MEKLAEHYPFAQFVPVSARNGEGVDALENAILELLPESPPFFPLDQVTDRSLRFMAAEFIREKLMRTLGEEVPYALTVEIEKFEDSIVSIINTEITPYSIIEIKDSDHNNPNVVEYGEHNIDEDIKYYLDNDRLEPINEKTRWTNLKFDHIITRLWELFGQGDLIVKGNTFGSIDKTKVKEIPF